MSDTRSGELNAIRRDGRDRAVIFLHGFTGTRDDTWDRFPGLLGTHLAGWDIFTLGYATTMLPDVVGIWSADPELPILATMLWTELQSPPLVSYKSLALVAHSMGGLVVQRALANDGGLVGRVRDVVLFGTPSNGLRKASWLQFWKRQLRNMARDSDFIAGLRTDWRKRFVPNPPFQLVVVAGASDQFVTPDSSLEPFDIRFQRVVPGNHIDIVKPADANALSLRLLVSALSNEVQPPAATMSDLALAAERPTANVEQLVDKYEQAGAQARGLGAPAMTEAQVVQAALALERAGDRTKAIELLERYRALGTDVQGTLGGRIKRIWFETEDPHDAHRSLDLYQHALEIAEGDLKAASDDRTRIKAKQQIYYHAINVAFLELVFRHEPDRARAMAERAAAAASSVPEDVWSVATLAEVELYRGDTAAALNRYRQMLQLGGEPWQFASAGLQASRVAAHNGDQALAEELDKLFTPGARQLNRIFVSYSHKDKSWLERLQTMAKPYLRQAEVELDMWVDTRIQAGDVWRRPITEALRAAGVAVALVSADFLASDFVWDHEMPEILGAAKRSQLRLLWVYLSPAGWEETPLKDFQAAHDTARPLSALTESERDEALKRIAREIKQAALGATAPLVQREGRLAV